MLRRTGLLAFGLFGAAATAVCQPLPPTISGGQPVAIQLPPAVQGRWGLTSGDCRAGAADAKGLMVVEPAKVSFYESRGTLIRGTESDASRMVADVAFRGEGQSWTRTMIPDAQQGRRTLIRRDYGDGATPVPFGYTTCD